MIRHDSIRRFLKDDRGGILIEFLFMLPLLIWAWIALVVFWDVFGTINTSQKAAYSISDLISRQEENVSPDFLNGMQDVFDFLMVNNADNGKIRITSLAYDADDDKYFLIFSVSPENKVAPYTETQLEALKDRIPTMGDTDSVVIVETFVEYTFPFRIPFIDAGVVAVDENSPAFVQVYSEFVVTRPRFKSYICLDTVGCPVGLADI
jgi:hypothetical protein